jgi:hypothetical protein
MDFQYYPNNNNNTQLLHPNPNTTTANNNTNTTTNSPTKRIKNSTDTWYYSYNTIFDIQEEFLPVDSPIGFSFTESWTQDILFTCSQRWWFQSLKSLNLDVTIFIDQSPNIISLILTPTDGCIFPMLESLSLTNQAIKGIRLHEQHSPLLKSIRIQHPCGIPIEIFDLQCPLLEEVIISYATIQDGYGLQRSIDKNRHPRMNRVERFATTTYFMGVI